MTTIPYHFVPAGISFQAIRHFGIYIKYKKGNNSIEFPTVTPNYIHIKAPDRELVIVAGKGSSTLPPFSYDEYIPLDLFNATTSESFQESPYFLQEYMINFLDCHGKKGHTPYTRRGPYKSGPRIMSDSGGYQISRDRIDFVNPYQLIQFYNENVDVGMVLDIPFFSQGADDILAMSMEAQANNNKILVENKRDDLELVNVCHGHTPKAYRRFHDGVYRPEIRRLAIGLAYTATYLSSLHRILDTSEYTQGLYDSYHILGVSNIVQVISLIKMAQLELIPYITSDSTTHIQASVNREYIFSPFLTAPFKRVKLKKSEYKASSDSLLPCNCPVCSALRYTDIMVALENALGFSLLAFHNMFTTLNYITNMKNVIQEVSTKELKEIMAVQFASRSSNVQGEMSKMLDFLAHTKDHGLEAARKKFAFYLKTLDYGNGESKPLFGGTAELRLKEDLVVNEEESELEGVEWERARFRKVMSNFATCWAGNVEAKGKRNKNPSFSANRAITSSTVALSGGKRKAKLKVGAKSKRLKDAHNKANPSKHPKGSSV